MASKTQKSKKKTAGSKGLSQKSVASAGFLKGYPEVKILIAFALWLFLMLCNFHLCSIVGNVFFVIMHGLFGFASYIFPVVIFLGYSFLLSNAGRREAVRKVLLGSFIYLTICSIFSVFGETAYGTYNPVYYFKEGQRGFNGGMCGGLIGSGLSHITGKLAAVLFLVIILIILGILITERNLTNVFFKSVDQSRQYLEEKKRFRIEKKEAKELSDQESEQDLPYEEEDYIQDELPDAYYEASESHDPASVFDKVAAKDRDTLYDDKQKEDPDAASYAANTQEYTEDPDAYAEQDVIGKNKSGTVGADRQAAVSKRPFSVNLRDFGKNHSNEETTSKLNTFFNNRIPFIKEKTEKAVIHSSNTRKSLSESPVQDGLNGRSFVKKASVTLPKNTMSMANMGFEDYIKEEVNRDTTDQFLTIDDFILYNGIREWREEDPFVMPEEVQKAPASDTDEYRGPIMVRGAMADILSAEEWIKNHDDTDQNQGIRAIKLSTDQNQEMTNLEEEDSEFLTDEVDTSPYVFPVEKEHFHENIADEAMDFHDNVPEEEAVDLTEDVELPETFTEPVKKKNWSDSDSIWRTRDNSSDRSDSGAVTFSKPVKAAPVKKTKKPYKKAPLKLLSDGGEFKLGIKQDHIEVKNKLHDTLESFGVHVKMGAISVGPAVTRYELEPDVGVKVSRIVGLQDDIKLALAAADVRIEAPIPGKSAVGIEVPNAKSTTVGFKELIDTEKFRTHPSKLCVAIGRDLSGQIQLADLAKMPHLLIAGATGSGKSVCINTLIMSILYKATPDEVKLIMVDPKVVELSAYNGIPHLLIPVVTDPRKASNALRWAVDEMDERYKKLAEYKVRNIQGYNEEIKKLKKDDPTLDVEPMYQMVIIVDELADLMMVAPGEVEESICRLAQKARAAGIHLVLATQRPSVNVITGLIKANVPSRIAFAVSSGVDSRTILDMNGAEKLLGRGDMLYYPYGLQKPIRIQGAFISDEEVSRVVEYIVDHNNDSKSGAAQMEEMITNASAEVPGTKSVTDGKDEHFADAARFIIESDKASIGALQRKFRIGFNRAARLMDALADEGIVGEEEGTKPRKILMSMEELDNYLNNQS